MRSAGTGHMGQAPYLEYMYHLATIVTQPQNSDYCKVERNKTRDVAPSRSRPDHRKSKFELRHGIKLGVVFFMTESEF